MLFYFSISVIGQKSFEKETYTHLSGRRQLNLVGEIGGNGLLMSVGLEHEKYKFNVLQETFRYGISIVDYSLLAEYNKDFGKNNHYFELGIGPTLHYDQGLSLFLFGRIGYRYNSSRFIFRVGFTPYLVFYNQEDSPALMPHFGVTLGIPLKHEY